MPFHTCPLCLLDLPWLDLLHQLKEGDEEVVEALSNEQELCAECRATLEAWVGSSDG